MQAVIGLLLFRRAAAAFRYRAERQLCIFSDACLVAGCNSVLLRVTIELIYNGGMLRSGSEVPQLRGPCPSMGSAEIHDRLAAELAAFGSDDHYAICTAGAINSSSARVLQYFDA